jgi:heme oxygenase
MPKQKKTDFDWEAVVNGNRIGVTQVMNSIRNGVVDEEEFEKLQNFVQFALALMQLCGPQKWTQAKMNAEMMNYLKENNK